MIVLRSFPDSLLRSVDAWSFVLRLMADDTLSAAALARGCEFFLDVFCEDSLHGVVDWRAPVQGAAERLAKARPTHSDEKELLNAARENLKAFVEYKKQ